MLWWFRFLNERRDGFVLLLTGRRAPLTPTSSTTGLEKMTEGTWTYYAEARRRGLCTVDMTQEELHVVLSAFLDHHLRALYPRLRLAGDPAPLYSGLPSL